uniref:Immunoglobulin V-set domain-containing protein n=1 Tax=Erpetoichthys calabaricus TaxID=27687 RepID=A0A8C4RYR8_ERPCA
EWKRAAALSLKPTQNTFVTERNMLTVVHGIVGGREKLQVVCEYNYRYKLHNKYFCRHPCNSDNDVLVLSSKPETLVTRGRFHLFDYSSNCNIRVTVDNVQLTDTGTYYCGIEVSLRLDRFTQVFIKVEKGKQSECYGTLCENAKSSLLRQESYSDCTRWWVIWQSSLH